MMLCNRSGFCRRSGSGLRAPKISIKSENDCTAFLTVHIYNDGRVKSEHCMEHVGHGLEMARLRMSEEEKAEISRYLEDGHETTWIIEKIRDKNSGNRLMYITAQAVDYLRSCLYIDSGRLHTNDMASVAEAVRLDGVVDEADENAAPAWRNYFSYSPASDSSGTSFSLGLQTQEQAEWLKEFGNKGVCFDATHNSTRYSFKLITIMVLDNCQKGRPVAHFFCKEENEADLITFFNGVKDRCGIPLMPEVIMTDDAVQYWTAWVKVFGEQSTRKLLCSWHIAKNWGMKAKDLIVDANVRKEVLTSLHKLVRLPDEASFRQHLVELLTWMDVAGCEDFKKYFFENYVKKEDRLMSWASFNRRRSVLNTNMALERFHGKLKSHILKKSENRRLDFVLYGLEKFCRNLVRDVIVQDTLKTRHHQYRLYQTHKSHRKAMATYAQTQFDGIECTDQEGVYRVKSLTQPNLFHFMRQIKKRSCPYETRCGYFECGVCWEEFDCDCYASCKAGVACVLVHAVQMSLGPWQTSSVYESSVTEACSQEPTLQEDRSLLPFEKWSKMTDNQLQTVNVLMRNVSASVSNEMQSDITKKLDELIATLKSSQDPMMVVPRHQINGRPPNALPQRVDKV
uniref:MULE transposase domain-containing protein n=1 Tax=Plectus sambesii TaxID=2011161 RepID=A0A914W1Q6_9BILA